MACSPPSRDAGFATPAALVFCLAIALLCSALVTRSVVDMRLSTTELVRTQAALALDGAALSAETAIIRNAGPGPFRWTLTVQGVQTEVLAEPEAGKVGLAAAAALPDATFQAFGVQDIAALRARLAAPLAPGLPVPQVASLDAADAWTACAPSAVSPYGLGDAVRYAQHNAPDTVADQPAWHIGEAWRLRITTSAGWRDDRIVRFTGNPQHPAAVVGRTLMRVGSGGGECDELLTALAGG